MTASSTRLTFIDESSEARLEGVGTRGELADRTDSRYLTAAIGHRPMLELYARAKVRRPPSPIHCLRRTLATEMSAAGVPLPVLQRMGHASIETNEEQKRAAVARVFGQPVGNRNAKAPRTEKVTGPWGVEIRGVEPLTS